MPSASIIPTAWRRPMRRVGAKGCRAGSFEPIPGMRPWTRLPPSSSARREIRSHRRLAVFLCRHHGPGAADGMHRLRHEMKYSREKETICASPFRMRDGRPASGLRGVDPREIADADLIVVWGGNPVSTQVNVMTHIARAPERRAAQETDRGRSLSHRHRRGRRSAHPAEARHRRRPGRGDDPFACSPRDWRTGATCGKYATMPTRSGIATDAEMGGSHHRRAGETIRDFAPVGRTSAASSAVGYIWLLALAQRRRQPVYAVSCLPTVTGAWAHGRRRALFQPDDLPDRQFADHGPLEMKDPASALDQSRIGAVPTGDRRHRRRSAGRRHADPEHQPDGGLPDTTTW